MPLTEEEKNLIKILEKKERWKDISIEEICRIKINGSYADYDSKFSADLRLATIRASNWTSPNIYNLNDGCGPIDYSDPHVMDMIDWSCIRDSSENAINSMYKIAKKEVLSKYKL